jgi:hypothetical protein
MNTRGIYGTQDGDRLAAQFLDVNTYLGLSNVCAQAFVQLLLGLRNSQPGHVDAPYQRHLDGAIAVNASRFVGRFIEFGARNLQLVIGTQLVTVEHWAVAVYLREIRTVRRSDLPGRIHGKEKYSNCN